MNSHAHPVFRDILNAHAGVTDTPLQVLADLVAYVERSDTDDTDFGRGFAQSGLIERARALTA